MYHTGPYLTDGVKKKKEKKKPGHKNYYGHNRGTPNNQSPGIKHTQKNMVIKGMSTSKSIS